MLDNRCPDLITHILSVTGSVYQDKVFSILLDLDVTEILDKIGKRLSNYNSIVYRTFLEFDVRFTCH